MGTLARARRFYSMLMDRVCIAERDIGCPTRSLIREGDYEFYIWVSPSPSLVSDLMYNESVRGDPVDHEFRSSSGGVSASATESEIPSSPSSPFHESDYPGVEAITVSSRDPTDSGESFADAGPTAMDRFIHYTALYSFGDNNALPAYSEVDANSPTSPSASSAASSPAPRGYYLSELPFAEGSRASSLSQRMCFSHSASLSFSFLISLFQ